jgi:Fic family protein
MENYPHILFKKHWEILPAVQYQLGECDAINKAIANSLLRPKDRGRLMLLSLIKGAQATTAIEGNTLSQEEIERIFEGNKLPASREYQQIEVENVKDAFNYILDEVVRGGNEWSVTPDLICDFHKRITQNLGEHIDGIPGKWREDRRQVGPYLAPEHRYIPELMKRLCDWIRDEFHYHRDQDFSTAILQAIITHVYIEWIHPFADGNGRTGRLIEFFILLRSGLPSVVSHILSNFYNQTRTEYYRQLNTARKKRDLTGFVSYAVQGFRDGLVENLKIIQEGQLKIFWRNHIYESFKDLSYLKKNVFKRKRSLMLAAPIDRWFSMDEIDFLNLETTREYAVLKPTTLKRDLEELVKMDLLVKKDFKYHAKTGILSAYFPERKERI